MVHQHGAVNASNGCRNTKSGKCKYHYDDFDFTERTYFEKGYPRYKRSKPVGSISSPKHVMVVPHNREILEAWDGHANVEYSGFTYTVLYLYKYLFKGAKKVKVRFVDEEEAKDSNEGKFFNAFDI